MSRERSVCAVAALAVAMTLAATARAQCPDGTPPPCARSARGAGQPAATSVAVLYFDNISRDTSDTYVAEGLTEELIARLGQVERLQVKSRTAVQRYRGRAADDPAAMGRALGVANLVSGSVRRGSGRLRVTVELTRASTGVRVWGDTYERSSDDLMAVETDIAQAIAEGVGGRLAPTERHELVARPTTSAEAYDHYLRGNFLLAKREPSLVRRAIAEYEAAVRLDPGFARAFGRIGFAYTLFDAWGWPWPGLTRDSLIERSGIATETALRLDSLSPEAWTAAAATRMNGHPTTFAGVEAALERATRLDPRNAEAWHMTAVARSYLGNDSGAADAFMRALALEPERIISLGDFAWVRYLQRRFDEAARLLDSALTLDPDAYYVYAIRAVVALHQGDSTRARAAAAAATRTSPESYAFAAEWPMAALEARCGDTAAARARIDRLIGLLGDHEPGYFEGTSLALGLVAVGDYSRALDMLERARPRGIILGSYLRDPFFDVIRTDPRFQRLLDQTRPR